MEEYIDEFNSFGEKIDSHPKSLLSKRMFLHQVCLVIPKTEEGKLILSKRSKTKYPFPDTWCCAVGGKVASGETEEDAVIREMREEIGVNFPVIKISSTVYDKEDYKGIFNVFTSVSPIDLKDFVLDEAEIQYSESFSVEEINKMIHENKNQFAPTFLAVLEDFINSLK